MNIFATSPDPVESAIALDDARLNKMIVESCQILCTALHLTGRASAELYRPAYVRHPVVLWAARDERNYGWLYRHLEAMLAERSFRTGGRPHRSSRLMPVLALRVATDEAPESFQNCTPFPEQLDVHRAYRMTLTAKWRSDARRPKWSRRSPPSFVKRSGGRASGPPR